MVTLLFVDEQSKNKQRQEVKKDMKKLLAIFLAVVMVAALGSGIALAAKPGTDFNGAHYNLNIVGKKADWSGGGSYDNWDRHTMFVPGNTTGWTIDRGAVPVAPVGCRARPRNTGRSAVMCDAV
jgi:hypothetical protein